MDTGDLIKMLEKLEDLIHSYLQEPTLERRLMLDAEIAAVKERLKETVARLKETD